jgi:predicted transcriptional regulator YdeE
MGVAGTTVSERQLSFGVKVLEREPIFLVGSVATKASASDRLSVIRGVLQPVMERLFHDEAGDRTAVVIVSDPDVETGEIFVQVGLEMEEELACGLTPLTLPSGRVAAACFDGPADALDRVRQELIAWLQKRRYVIAGSAREVYVCHAGCNGQAILREVLIPIV